MFLLNSTLMIKSSFEATAAIKMITQQFDESRLNKMSSCCFNASSISVFYHLLIIDGHQQTLSSSFISSAGVFPSAVSWGFELFLSHMKNTDASWMILSAEGKLVTVIVLLKWEATADGVEAAEQKPTQERSSDWLSAAWEHWAQIHICCCTHSSAASLSGVCLLSALLLTHNKLQEQSQSWTQ